MSDVIIEWKRAEISGFYWGQYQLVFLRGLPKPWLVWRDNAILDYYISDTAVEAAIKRDMALRGEMPR